MHSAFYLQQVVDRDLTERFSKIACLVSDTYKLAKDIMVLQSAVGITPTKNTA